MMINKFIYKVKSSIIMILQKQLMRYIYKHYDGCSTHPHNLFIQILSETGLIGIFFYLIFLFWIYLI